MRILKERKGEIFSDDHPLTDAPTPTTLGIKNVLKIFRLVVNPIQRQSLYLFMEHFQTPV
jgi:hypothetical protein